MADIASIKKQMKAHEGNIYPTLIHSKRINWYIFTIKPGAYSIKNSSKPPVQYFYPILTTS